MVDDQPSSRRLASLWDRGFEACFLHRRVGLSRSVFAASGGKAVTGIDDVVHRKERLGAGRAHGERLPLRIVFAENEPKGRERGAQEETI